MNFIKSLSKPLILLLIFSSTVLSTQDDLFLLDSNNISKVLLNIREIHFQNHDIFERFVRVSIPYVNELDHKTIEWKSEEFITENSNIKCRSCVELLEKEHHKYQQKIFIIKSKEIMKEEPKHKEPQYTDAQLKNPTLQGFFQSQQPESSKSDEKDEFDFSFEPYKEKPAKPQKAKIIPQCLAKPNLFERLTFQTPAEDIEVHPWKQKGHTSQSPKTKLLFKGNNQDIVTYFGIKMLRRDAKSSWQAYQNESRKIREEEEKRKINQRREKYQEEKKSIDYERATYKGLTLMELKYPQPYTSNTRLSDLDPWTVKELEDADRINPDRQRERNILQQQKQQAENKRQEELEREQAEREEYKKTQPGYWRGSLSSDDLYDQDRFRQGWREEAYRPW